MIAMAALKQEKGAQGTGRVIHARSAMQMLIDGKSAFTDPENGKETINLPRYLGRVRKREKDKKNRKEQPQKKRP